MTDLELIEASLRGEHAAYGQLVERYQRMVEAVAFSATGERDLADDVVQDTFVAAWSQLDRLREPGRLRPWLCGIARNQARKSHRRRWREASAVEVVTTQTPFDVASERERDGMIAEALAGLAPRYREPLVLFYYEQCSVKEVAVSLAIREDAAMQRLSRGRQQLGDVLADRVEVTLERRRSRKALALCVLAVLPALRVQGAAAATIAGEGAPAVTTSRAFGTAIVARWRWGAGALAAGVVAIGMWFAVARSDQVAARADLAKDGAHEASSTAPKPAARAARKPPRLPAPHLASEQVHRNMAVASVDPVESCERVARGLAYATLGVPVVASGSRHSVASNQYFAQSEAVAQQADALATKAGASCAGDPWPELYVICEGTLADVLDSTVACYPYDPFAPGG